MSRGSLTIFDTVAKIKMPISLMGRRTLLQKRRLAHRLTPCIYRKRGRWCLMGHGRWIITVLRYAAVTILVLWLLTIKAY